MAETAAGSAPNGKKIDEDEVSGGTENLGVTYTKNLVDLNPSSMRVLNEKVIASDPADSTVKVSADSTVKVPVGTKAVQEVVAKGTSDHKRGDTVPVKEDVKEGVEAKSEAKNAGKARTVSKEATVTVGSKLKEAKETEVENVKVHNANDSSLPKLDHADAGAMDIDDKDQGESEEKLEAKIEEKAGVVVNPKKKLGRPRKVRDAEVTKEELKSPVNEAQKRPRQKKEPVTPLSERDRPARERKSIERFVASVEKGKKELVIKQGSGTPLMDIPNVAFKLSKRAKGDEILNMLHSLLYNKRAKANVIKYNIFRFSGFVWDDNEEKERIKVREKLERYTKEGLGQLIDVLDLHLNRTGKKDELVVKVLEFLESPHKTTEVSLEEREQKMKEKKRKSKSGSGRWGPGRKQRKLDESGSTKKMGRRKKNESEEDTGDYANSEDESLEEEEVERKRLTFIDEQDDDDGDDDNDKDYASKQKSHRKPSKPAKVEEQKVSNDEDDSDSNQGSKRTLKSTSGAPLKPPKALSPDITRGSTKPAEKVYTKESRKRAKESKEKEKEKAASAKQTGKQKFASNEKSSEKSTGRGRRGKVKESSAKKKKKADIPPDDILQIEIRDLLKDLSPADFSKVTFMDIVLQLEEKFNVDLSVKKTHVKLLIRQEVSRLADEDGDDEDEDQGTIEPEVEAADLEAETEAKPEKAVNSEGAGADITETTEGVEAAESADEVEPGVAPEVETSPMDVEAGTAEVPMESSEMNKTEVQGRQLQTREGAGTVAKAGVAVD